MNTKNLAESYLKKSSDRLDILDLLLKKEAYSDVIRESQEVVKLSLKGMLRFIGVEPPKIHDVGGLLLEHRDKFPKDIAEHLKKWQRFQKGSGRNGNWLSMETLILFPLKNIREMTLKKRLRILNLL